MSLLLALGAERSGQGHARSSARPSRIVCRIAGGDDLGGLVPPAAACVATGCSPAGPGRRRSSRCGCLAAGSSRRATGHPGAEERHRHDGRTGDQARGRPRRPAARSCRRHRACLRGRHRRRAPPAAPAPRCGSRARRRGTGRAGSGRRRAGSRPARGNISCLVSACTGRGEQIASSGPSSQPTWLAAITTGPVAGTRSAPWISRSYHRRTSAWAKRAPAVSSRCAVRARRRWRAALHRRCGERRSWPAHPVDPGEAGGPEDAPTPGRRCRRPARRPRRGCTAWCRCGRRRRP